MTSPTTSELHSNRKTDCPICAVPVWNWHIKRHLRQVHDVGSGSQTPSPFSSPESIASTTASMNQAVLLVPHGPNAARASSCAVDHASISSSRTNNPFETDDESSDDSNEDADNVDMMDEQVGITIDTYIRNLPEQYDPKRVLQYLQWCTRKLTMMETEVVRFLRNLSFGAGVSRDHAQQSLNYVRDLGMRYTYSF
jgi:hypothetical protein